MDSQTLHTFLRASLVIDNNLLVNLSEFFCERRAQGTRARVFCEKYREWILEIMSTIKQFTPNGCIYCTQCVADEFNPHAGRLNNQTANGLGHNDREQLGSYVRSLLQCVRSKQVVVDMLKALPQAPRRLVGPGGLSDEDLSLIGLALDLAADNRQFVDGSPRVYILTSDQDLLSFVSWVKTSKAAKEIWATELDLVEGLQSFTYLELVHRSCRISTDVMQDLINFVVLEHYSRADLRGQHGESTPKGESIMQKLQDVYISLAESMRIKALQGARQ